MANKLAMAVMANISKGNLNKRNKSNTGRRLEVSSPYGSNKGKVKEYSSSKDMETKYEQQKMISLSNYSSNNRASKTGPSSRNLNSTRKRPARQGAIDLPSLAREIKGESSEAQQSNKNEARKLNGAGKKRITLNELSQAKGGKTTNNRDVKAKEDLSLKSNTGERELTLDSLARIHKRK